MTRSALERCREALDHADALNGRLNAFNTIARDSALARAAALDGDPGRWRDAPLAGVDGLLAQHHVGGGVDGEAGEPAPWFGPALEGRLLAVRCQRELAIRGPASAERGPVSPREATAIAFPGDDPLSTPRSR